MTNTPPSANPADDGTLQGTVRTVLEKFLQRIDNMLPARIVSFDRATNRAIVEPMVMLLKTDGDGMARAQVENVPVFQYSGGGFVINFPLKVGDIGWLHANDRDLTLFTQGYKQAVPNTLRKHSFEDSMFFPDVMRGWTVEGEGLVIQTMSGNQCIRILDDQIKITSDALVNIESAVDVVIKAAHITLDAPLTTINGTLVAGTNDGHSATFSGPIETLRTVTAHGEIETLIDNIKLSSHRHSGVQPGGGNTGEPIP